MRIENMYVIKKNSEQISRVWISIWPIWDMSVCVVCVCVSVRCVCVCVYYMWTVVYMQDVGG